MRRIVCAIYLTALVLMTGCRPPGPKSLIDGERLIRAGKFPEAIVKLERATQLLPSNAQAWNHLGLAYQYGGKPDEALRAYQQALSLDRNLPAIRFNLGNLHLEQGRLNEAMMELTTATVLQTNAVEAYVLLGKAQLRAKRVDDADRSFAQALRLDQNNVEALNYYGVVQLHRRKREAIAYFNAALKIDANYSPAVLNQAIYNHYYVVNKTNALERYRQYLSMKPDAAGAATAMEAARALEAELYPKPVAVVNTNPLPALIVTNRPVVAAATPTNLPPVHKTPTNVAHAAPTNKPAAVATVVTNIPSPAKPTAVTIVTNAPAAPLKTNETKVAAVVTNKPPVAEKAIEKPIEKPVEKPVLTVAAKETEKAKEPEEAPKPLEVVNVDEDAVVIAPAKDIPKPASTTAPGNGPSQVATAKPKDNPLTNDVIVPPPLIRPVRPEEKTTVLKKANPLNWFKRGEKEEKPAEEKEVVVAKKPTPKADLKTLPEPPPIQPAAQSQPEPERPRFVPEPIYARYPYRKSELLPPAGDRTAALASFNSGIKAHQDGKLGAAMDNYREALRIDPRFLEAQLNLGIAAASANDLSLALAALEDSVRLDPKSAEARYQFALVLRRANYPADAVNELKTAQELAPQDARAYLALGNIYSQVMNKTDLAAANYRKTLELDPQHPQAPQIRSWLAQH